MYERSTGAYLLEIENLEKEVARLQGELDAVNADIDIVRTRLKREQDECDEQVRIVIKYARMYNSESDLANSLAYALALKDDGETRESALNQWKTARGI